MRDHPNQWVHQYLKMESGLGYYMFQHIKPDIGYCTFSPSSPALLPRKAGANGARMFWMRCIWPWKGKMDNDFLSPPSAARTPTG
ncbi:MAG: hypothetical protein MUD03_14345 [Pirellula sp.]|nr:hypothetical protein [Pirellula sp.]